MVVIHTFEIALLAILSFVLMYQVVFVLASFPWKECIPTYAAIHTHRFAVLVLARNEEVLIGRCLYSLLSADYPKGLRDIFVVADNCTDRTEEISHMHEVICLERNDLSKQGKGHAIEWGLQRIGLHNYEAVLFLDADAVASPNIFLEIDRLLARGEKAIQVYNGTLNAEENWLTRCAHLSDVLQFQLYFKGRENLKLTSRLLGNGMCLHREVLERVPWRAYSITENWEYHLDVILTGYRVAFTAGAAANSDQVVSLTQGKVQKSRWQIGWTKAVMRYVPLMVSTAWRKRNLRLADAAVDFVLPSPSMQAGLLAIAVVGGFFVGHKYLQIWGLALVLMGTGLVGVCLVIARCGYMDYLAIVCAPVYVIWKLLLRASLVLLAGPREWLRTARE